jgi:hypothetical protein
MLSLAKTPPAFKINRMHRSAQFAFFSFLPQGIFNSLGGMSEAKYSDSPRLDHFYSSRFVVGRGTTSTESVSKL